MALTQIAALRSATTCASLYVRPAAELARRFCPLLAANLGRRHPNMVRDDQLLLMMTRMCVASYLLCLISCRLTYSLLVCAIIKAMICHRLIAIHTQNRLRGWIKRYSAVSL